LESSHNGKAAASSQILAVSSHGFPCICMSVSTEQVEGLLKCA
jgi:hypothetical protein